MPPPVSLIANRCVHSDQSSLSATTLPSPVLSQVFSPAALTPRVLKFSYFCVDKIVMSALVGVCCLTYVTSSAGHTRSFDDQQLSYG